jgi:hypothetical protein
MTARKKTKVKKPYWMKDLRFRLPVTVLAAAFVALVAHVYLETWARPIIRAMTETVTPTEGGYPQFIIFMAYFTACISVGVVAYLYHYLGQYMPVRKKWQRVLLLAAIVLEVKGELIRQPVMDFMVNLTVDIEQPLMFVVVSHMDKWIANLLLAAIIVYLCPLRKDKGRKAA